MKGCRNLSLEEIGSILAELSKNPNALRDRALFLLGLRTGFEISELLSLRVGDVIQNGNYADSIMVARKNMKKKMEGRRVALHSEAKGALKDWISELSKSRPGPEVFVFLSRQGGNKAMGRINAWGILKAAYKKCGLTGKLGTHSMRKTFAKKVYDALDHDLIKTQRALGHASVNSTVSYLSFAEEDIDDAILKS